MILVAVGGLSLLASYLVYWRCAVEMRSVKWQLYGLRDELRSIAFDHRELLDSDVFQTLDNRLSVFCTRLEGLSLWSVLPVVFFSDRKRIDGLQRNFTVKLHQPKNVVLVDVYERSCGLLVRHLVYQHMFTVIFALATVVTIVFCYTAPRWVSERVLSGALRPITADGLSSEHAVA